MRVVSNTQIKSLAKSQTRRFIAKNAIRLAMFQLKAHRLQVFELTAQSKQKPIRLEKATFITPGNIGIATKDISLK
jgi:hypothetical protein